MEPDAPAVVTLSICRLVICFSVDMDMSPLMCKRAFLVSLLTVGLVGTLYRGKAGSRWRQHLARKIIVIEVSGPSQISTCNGPSVALVKVDTG